MALYVARTVRALLDAENWGSFVGGKLELSDLTTAREFHRRLRGREPQGREAPSAGDLYALARLEEISQAMISRHLHERDPGALEGYLQRGRRVLGGEETERLLTLFGRDYSLPGGREALLREFLVWWAIADNPAAAARRWKRPRYWAKRTKDVINQQIGAYQ